MKWYFVKRWFDDCDKWKNSAEMQSLPLLPRSAIELAVQLFCIPVDGRKSDSNDRLVSKLESKILEERTSLMRLDTWSWIKIDSGARSILTKTDLTVLWFRRMSLDSPTCDVPVVGSLTVLKHSRAHIQRTWKPKLNSERIFSGLYLISNRSAACRNKVTWDGHIFHVRNNIEHESISKWFLIYNVFTRFTAE